jgi:hypothetical protein
MKTFFLAGVFAGMLVLLASPNAGAQVYAPSPYGSYWDGFQYQPYPYAQQYDPYYDLHVMHYQLYLQPYPGYPTYQPFVTGVAPFWPQTVLTVPRVIVTPRPQAMRRR